jgi:hypothetical protein
MGGEGGVAEGVAEGSRQDAAKEAEKALVAKEATQACEGWTGGPHRRRAGVKGGGLYASRLRAALKRRRQLGRARRHE